MVDDPDPPAMNPPIASATDPTQVGDGQHAATLPGGTATPDQDTLVPSQRPTPLPVNLPAPGYQFGALIGRGGMGEVVAAHDQRMARDVAIKRMRTAVPDGEQVSRFLREARIQARLDHPAIVPVYELGTDADGRPYFTMKRISGKTLADRMTEGASMQALLRAFVDVCQAIDLAHARGVVHRDLKPSNIMLGDFGEVYVLDWGIARVLADGPEKTSDIITLDDHTQTGAMLGTPGYMSPEQIRGLPATPAADVYALGAILFEILTGSPLHPRGHDAIESTLTTARARPSRRAPERPIPPELDDLCYEALAETPSPRPTARELATRAQSYLDGDRDLEARRALAELHLVAAQEAAATDTAASRALAIREAGLALALDHRSTAAGTLLTSLLVKPPDPLSPELHEALAADERKVTRKRTRVGLRAYLSLFAFWPLFPLMGVKSWGWLAALYVVITALMVNTWIDSRRGRYNIAFALVGNLVLTVVWTRLAGTLLLTPVFTCSVLLALGMTTWVSRRPWLIVAYAAASVLVPVAAETLGWMPASWEVTRTSIISHSTIFEMEGTIADISMIGATIAFITIFGLVAARLSGAEKSAKRALAIQAWHLKHLVPRGASLPAIPATRS